VKTRTPFSWEWGHLYRESHPGHSRSVPHILFPEVIPEKQR
jgi:hypothetical protein